MQIKLVPFWDDGLNERVKVGRIHGTRPDVDRLAFDVLARRSATDGIVHALRAIARRDVNRCADMLPQWLKNAQREHVQAPRHLGRRRVWPAVGASGIAPNKFGEVEMFRELHVRPQEELCEKTRPQLSQRQVPSP